MIHVDQRGASGGLGEGISLKLTEAVDDGCLGSEVSVPPRTTNLRLPGSCTEKKPPFGHKLTSARTEGGSDVSGNRFDDMCIVCDAQLVGDCQD
jgi:hypothetical protein